MVGLKVIIVSTFIKNYEKMKINEEDIFENEQVLKKYYPDLNKRLRLFYSSQVCNITHERRKNFNREGCENNLDNIMKEGLRGSISIITTNLYKLYYTFINEKEMTPENIQNKYINDTLIANLGTFDSNNS